MDHEDRRARRKLIAEQVRNGKSVKDVAKEHGVGHSSIYSACREHGVKINREMSLRTFDILKQLLDGKTFHAVADNVGVSKARVWLVAKMAREAGIVLPRRRR